MSREIFPSDERIPESPELAGDLYVTSFFGGEARSMCLQFTPRTPLKGYAHMTRSEVAKLVEALADWLDETAPMAKHRNPQEKP